MTTDPTPERRMMKSVWPSKPGEATVDLADTPTPDDEPLLLVCEGSGSPTHYGVCSMCGHSVATNSMIAMLHTRDDIIARIERGDFDDPTPRDIFKDYEPCCPEKDAEIERLQAACWDALSLLPPERIHLLRPDTDKVWGELIEAKGLLPDDH